MFYVINYDENSLVISFCNLTSISSSLQLVGQHFQPFHNKRLLLQRDASAWISSQHTQDQGQLCLELQQVFQSGYKLAATTFFVSTNELL